MNLDPKSPAKPDGSAPPEKPPESAKETAQETPREIGGRKGPEPTRYGDWENGGKCVDF